MAGRKRERLVSAQTDRGSDLDPHWIGEIQERLVAWYAKAARKLPWRADRDPYRILVSETMLVQTTVTAVVPFFERFLARFPDFVSLANAEPDQVLKLWEGLGYYQRARRLQQAAQAVVAQHGGVMPPELEQIQALPGVGRYIAGAIRSFAFDLPAPILEANTQRVAARWIAWDKELRSTETQARLWRLAERIVPDIEPGTFNQAFMELGATICTPRDPLCLVCPVQSLCEARNTGMQDQIPVSAPKAAPKDVEEACVVVSNQHDEILMVRRGAGQLWERFWEFPTLNLSGANPAGRQTGDLLALTNAILALTGIKTNVGPHAASIRYAVTTHRVSLSAYLGECLGGSPKPGVGLLDAKWISATELSEITLASPTRRLVKMLIKHS